MTDAHPLILNTTEHGITFACPDCPDGLLQIQPWGVVISATPHEEHVTTAYLPVVVDPENDAGSRAQAGIAGIELVRTTFTGSPEAEAALTRLERTPFCPNCHVFADLWDDCPLCGYALAIEAQPRLIVGSIIAAQAFPGRVLAMVSIPGFERVPPEQKRMNPRKFTTFSPGAERIVRPNDEDEPDRPRNWD